MTIIILCKIEFDDLTHEQIVFLHESVVNNSTSPIDAAQCPARLSVMANMETVEHSASSEIIHPLCGYGISLTLC